MKIGIYAPYLNTYGGGEKYICKIAEILSEKHKVEFISFYEPDIMKLENRLNVNLSKVNFNLLKVPNLKSFAMIKTISSLTKNYDLFLNQEDHTVIPAYSQENIYMCQVPPIKLQQLYIKRVVENIIFDPKIRTYRTIIVYSYFVKKWVGIYYPQKKIDVLYPPIDTKQFYPLPKEKIILSVGRFFTVGHCKKQLEMIKIFKELNSKNDVLKKWEYHLVGGVSNNKEDQEYLEKCQKEAQGYPVFFHINTPFENLKTLYGKAKIFWHATGLNENETEHPDRMEHFGITTGEAMSASCVPIVINKGGQPEIVRNTIDGFTWDNIDELKKYTIQLAKDTVLWEKMSQNSIEKVQEFSVKNFEAKVKQIFI